MNYIFYNMCESDNTLREIARKYIYTQYFGKIKCYHVVYFNPLRQYIGLAIPPIDKIRNHLVANTTDCTGVGILYILGWQLTDCGFRQYHLLTELPTQCIKFP